MIQRFAMTGACTLSIIDGLRDAWAGLIVRKLRFRNKPTRLPGVLVANVRYWPLADMTPADSEQVQAGQNSASLNSSGALGRGKIAPPRKAVGGSFPA